MKYQTICTVIIEGENEDQCDEAFERLNDEEVYDTKAPCGWVSETINEEDEQDFSPDFKAAEILAR